MPNYPAQIDDSLSLPIVVDNSTPVSGSIFNKLRLAIIAVETELGIKPSTTFATVRARLDNLDNTLNNLQIISLAKDLGGTLTLPKVIGLQGRPLSDVLPSLNQVINWNGIAWEPKSLKLSGDVDGYVANTISVNKIRGKTLGISLSSLGSAQDGYSLVWINGQNEWRALPIGVGDSLGPAGGDLYGTYPNPTVSGIQGRLIDNSTPIDGYSLIWSNNDGYWKNAAVTDGYVDFQLTAGSFTNKGVGSNTFQRIGSCTINTSRHPVGSIYIFEGIFEATTSQTAELRLYNRTDGSTVSGSILSTSSNTSDYKSAVIVPNSGIKTYEVELRITAMSPGSSDGAICTNAKIRVKYR